MPPPGRHPGRSGRTAHGSVAYGFAWQTRRARAGVVVLCPPGRWDSRPCPRTYPQTRARPKQGPLAPVAFATFIATMGPSDSLSTRQDFALRLYPPPSPNVGRRGGSPQFRIRLSLRALFLPRECPAPLRLPKRSLLPSPRNDGLGHSTFRLPISRGCKVHASALGPQVRSPRVKPYGSAGLSTLRSDAALSGVTRSLLRGAPALTAAGLPPASLMQHLDRTVQARPRSGRTVSPECTPHAASGLMRPTPCSGPSNGAPPPAGRPPPRAAALRLPLPGDRGVRRRAGGPQRALPRPLPRLAPAVRGRVPLRGRRPRRGRLPARGRRCGPRAPAHGSLLLFGTSRPRPRRARLPLLRRRGCTPSSTSGSASSACCARPRSGPSPTTCSPRARRSASSASWAPGPRSVRPPGASSRTPSRAASGRRASSSWCPRSCSPPSPSSARCGAAGRRAWGRRAATPPPRPGARSLQGSLRLVLGSAHLRTIAGVVVLSSFVTAVCGGSSRPWPSRASAARTPWPRSSGPSTPGSGSPASSPSCSSPPASCAAWGSARRCSSCPSASSWARPASSCSAPSWRRSSCGRATRCCATRSTGRRWSCSTCPCRRP